MTERLERIAIIDHAHHKLFIEDVPVSLLESKYNGEEEKYIEDNYNLDGEYSWDFIWSAEYIGPDNPEPYDIDFDFT